MNIAGEAAWREVLGEAGRDSREMPEPTFRQRANRMSKTGPGSAS
jgi:hypothetical protein